MKYKYNEKQNTEIKEARRANNDKRIEKRLEVLELRCEGKSQEELKTFNKCGKVRLMFQDEAGFGRINKPKYCWCPSGIRPSVPCHHNGFA